MNLNVYPTSDIHASIGPLDIKRDWMEPGTHVYFCHPLVVANKLGFGIYLDKDIKFIYHGRSRDTSDSGIEVLEGEEYFYLERGEGIVSFSTGLSFESDANTSLLVMPVPNQIIDGVHPLTSMVSSSFFTASLHVVWYITKKNEVITVKAGTPIAAVVPINASEINNSTATFYDENTEKFKNKVWNQNPEYSDAMRKYVQENQTATGWYRKGVNHLGQKIGDHQVKSFNFYVKDGE